MDQRALHVSVCCFSSLHSCSIVPSRCLQPVCARFPCHLSRRYLWPAGGSRRKSEGARKGGVIGCSFSLVSWHIRKEEVSSPLVLQWQLQQAWVPLAAVGSVTATAATPQQQAPPTPTLASRKVWSSALLTAPHP